MPNHLHLILAPATRDGLSRAVGEAHRRYTAFVNARARVTGHLFQGRFGCVAMDEPHMLNAVRYLAFNPARATTLRGARRMGSGRACALICDGAATRWSTFGRFWRSLPRFGDLLELSPWERAELDGFEIARRPTAVRSAMRHSWSSPNANSAEACARASRDRNPGRRGQ